MNPNERCVILSGGIMEDYPYIKSLLRPDDYILCADSGIRHAEKLGVVPKVCLGDFDSFSGAIPFDCDMIRYPAEKDDTDTAAAAKEAVKRGFTEVLLLGGAGGRLDHTVANLQVLQYLHQRGICAQMADERSLAMLYSPGSYCLKRLPGFYLSLFSFGERCIIERLRGVKYPLTGALLTNGFPLGISNEFTEEYAELSFKNGDLLIILAKD